MKKAQYAEVPYEYTLDVDGQGKPIGGTWLSKNPDFLWAPIAQKECGRENLVSNPGRQREWEELRARVERDAIPS